jgi:hypothetical protein
VDVGEVDSRGSDVDHDAAGTAARLWNVGHRQRLGAAVLGDDYRAHDPWALAPVVVWERALRRG